MRLIQRGRRSGKMIRIRACMVRTRAWIVKTPGLGLGGGEGASCGARKINLPSLLTVGRYALARALGAAAVKISDIAGWKRIAT